MTDGVAAAGDKDVVVMGGANVIDQCLAAQVVDELRIHVSPPGSAAAPACSNSSARQR